MRKRDGPKRISRFVSLTCEVVSHHAILSQVSAKLYGILTTLAERCPSFGRSCVVLSTSHLSEKLGDMKLKKPAGETLTAFAEKTSLQFVLNQGMFMFPFQICLVMTF